MHTYLPLRILFINSHTVVFLKKIGKLKVTARIFVSNLRIATVGGIKLKEMELPSVIHRERVVVAAAVVELIFVIYVIRKLNNPMQYFLIILKGPAYFLPSCKIQRR